MTVRPGAGADHLTERGERAMPPGSRNHNPLGLNGGQRQRWTAAHTKRLKQLHADGMSCNGIAREMGFAPQVISRRCREMEPPLSFDRSRVEAANIARSVDAKARRQAVTDRIYGVLDDTLSHAEAAREGADGFKTHIKGEYGSDVEATLDFVPPTNRKDLSASIVQLVNASTKLEAIDSDSGNIVGRSLLEGLAAAFGIGPVDHGDDADPA